MSITAAEVRVMTDEAEKHGTVSYGSVMASVSAILSEGFGDP
ncbi:MAG: hypothetical protein MZV63_50975 [Marinilabiliales bacterium]|nr:hypothetical protein [Marinilabiliales bacterium]